MSDKSWGSYPKVWNVGHAALKEPVNFFDGEVRVEEKIDGSQFSFGIFDGEIRLRSKGRVFTADTADSMFKKAAATVLELAPKLQDGWTYRCEYLQKPKHNSLAYSRVPHNHLILFDVGIGDQMYQDAAKVRIQAEVLGLEAVPIFHTGVISGPDEVQRFMDLESHLGGTQLEGLVFKRTHAMYGMDGRPLIAKHVTERFKEIHGKEWSKSNPSHGDVVQQLVDKYCTEARWHKVVQHLRDDGSLEGSPRDIGPLLKELQMDMEAECKEQIMADLYSHYRKHFLRGSTRKFPEWYKTKLLEGQFLSED